MTLGGEGAHTATYSSTDALGNVESTQSLAYKIDTLAPALDVSFPATWCFCGGPLGFGVKASDATSAVVSLAVHISGNGTTPRVLKGPNGNFSGTLSWDGLDGAGQAVPAGKYSVWVGVTDAAGWTTTVGADVVIAAVELEGTPSPAATILLPTATAAPGQVITVVPTVAPTRTLRPAAAATAAAMSPTPTSGPAQAGSVAPIPVTADTSATRKAPWWPWALAAAAAAGAAYVKTRRKDEEAGQAKASTADAVAPSTHGRRAASRPVPGIPSVPDSVRAVRPTGMKTVPRYAAQPIKEGWKTTTKTVTRVVQEGWRTITERVPRLVSQVVQAGYKTVVEPVTEWVTKTVWEPAKKWFPGLGWLAEQVQKKVLEPVTRFVTKTVPNYVTRVVQDGWEFVTRTVPNYVQKTVQAGCERLTTARQQGRLREEIEQRFGKDAWQRRTLMIMIGAATTVAGGGGW